MEIGISEFCWLIAGELANYKIPENKLYGFIHKEEINDGIRLDFIEYLLVETRKTILSNRESGSEVEKKIVYSQDFIIQLQLVYIEMLARNNRSSEILA